MRQKDKVLTQSQIEKYKDRPGGKVRVKRVIPREICVNLARVYSKQRLFMPIWRAFTRRVTFHALPVLMGLREIARNPAAIRRFAR